MSTLELDPALLVTLRTLEEHDVEFVLVGDIAEAIYNDGGFVSGVAIVPGSYSRNVDRLCAALLSLNAELGIAGKPDDRQLDLRRGADLRELAPCSLMTMHADIDLDFEPHGTRGYRDLFDDAARVQLAPGVNPLVVSTTDLDRIARGNTPAPTPAALPPEPGDIWALQQIRV